MSTLAGSSRGWEATHGKERQAVSALQCVGMYGREALAAGRQQDPTLLKIRVETWEALCVRTELCRGRTLGFWRVL